MKNGNIIGESDDVDLPQRTLGKSIGFLQFFQNSWCDFLVVEKVALLSQHNKDKLLEYFLVNACYTFGDLKKVLLLNSIPHEI